MKGSMHKSKISLLKHIVVGIEKKYIVQESIKIIIALIPCMNDSIEK